MTIPSRAAAAAMTCAGCGTVVHGLPFQCPRAREGDDIDHVLTHVLDRDHVRFPSAAEPNPFVLYRQLLFPYDVARTNGMTDARFVAIVRELDAAVAAVDGAGFAVTPFARHPALERRIGVAEVWVKDETRNVAGSHKARHLMGIMVYLRVLEDLGLPSPIGSLAIASCGNAALAAAVVARAAGRALDVFVPPDAPAAVVNRLGQLGARCIVCSRASGRGDPCYLRFREAVRAGAIPFCCQGTANGLTIDGGKTLGYEMVSVLGGVPLDAVVIQVGGGALASSVVQAFADAAALGASGKPPRFHAVQTRGAFPLARAWERVSARIGRLPGRDTIERELRYAAAHRHEFMWPWEERPRSLARGILDDETYDWLAVVKGMLETGGAPVVVDEPTLEEAHALAREATPIDVDCTGAAGLAGVLALARSGALAAHERVAVVFSGATRG